MRAVLVKEKVTQISCYCFIQNFGAADIRQRYSHFVKHMKTEEASQSSSEADVCDSQGQDDHMKATVSVRPSLMEVH